jgi:tetratricopeptide (TPR) repeat protein
VTSATVDERSSIGSVGERAPTIARGERVDRYQIIRLLARGGMGAIYVALDPKLDRQIALKLLSSAQGPDAAERMISEAQALARLDDPHVVQVFDAGEYEGQVFIAMQLVDGEDLAAALSRKKASIAQIVTWFVEAGRGLAAAHAAGLVHRDFKPNNVLIDRRGRALVTDFGLAREIADTKGRTGMGVILGTPAYMSPEQHGSQAATEASDQFSFCVALWEALFGQHPFIEGDRTSIGQMSPYAIGYQIYDGNIRPPPKRSRVPRRVIDALTRGLQRDPAKRWPSMTALLTELAPAQKRSIWPLVAGAGMVAAAAGGAAVWFVLSHDRDAASICSDTANIRESAVWSPATAKQIRDKFGASGRSYAGKAADAAATSLDKYATRWRQNVIDVCTADHASAGPAPDLVVRRRACLDSRLDALRGAISLLGGEAKPELVDHAQQVVEGLPDLDDCNDTASLLAAPGLPPPEKSHQIEKLDQDIQMAVARGNGGDFEGSRATLAELAKQADAIGWAPLQARAHLAYGERLIGMLAHDPGELVKAGELATANHMDREAARAWADAMLATAWDRQPEGVEALAHVARASAARTGDKVLELRVDIAYGRAMTRVRKYQAALDSCRAVLPRAEQMDRANELTSARECMLEALVPTGQYAEVEKLVTELINNGTQKYGADHPTIADYLTARVQIERHRNELDKARADVERILEIRKKAFSPRHFKVAEALVELGQVQEDEGKRDEARATYEQALDVLKDSPDQILLLGNIHQALAFMEQHAGHHAAAIAHFEQALELERKQAGNDSLEVAFMLLNYGQVKANDNYEAGIGMLNEAHDILERHHDKRAPLTAGALAIAESMHGDYTSAAKHAQEVIDHADTADQHTVALMKYTRAKALVDSKGDKQQAHKLMLEAREFYGKAGKGEADVLADIDKWLKKH